jgi:PAS domain S-box-containing protein
LQPVPEVLAKNGEEVQAVYRDYQELQLAHSGLTQIYALTLTLTVLVALFGAFAVAFHLAKRLAAPLYLLTQGTQAVAQGDFSPRLVFTSGDELGGLTESFNQMTRQLDEARRETNRHRDELESAHAYLESILANLSTGVLVFDKHFVLRTVNAGAVEMLGHGFQHVIGKFVEEWPEHLLLGKFVRDGLAGAGEEGIWENQYEMGRPDGKKTILLLRGSRLPQSNGGYVLVFDDVSELISAQRSAAWGEVARRLAHEIKNPLTPIQLSAERIQMRLSERLSETDASMLARSTQTIINQVQAMKHMVDDFRDYAKMPPPQLCRVDFNGLIREILGLYESASVQFQVELSDHATAISGDPTQLRQVIHNLLRNAEDALEGRADGVVIVRTETSGKQLKFVLRDNGPGFPAEILPKVFEPYVTTKPRGTGLGLPIVKKIIDEHQGKIEITNLGTGGAQINVRLPLLELHEEGKL